MTQTAKRRAKTAIRAAAAVLLLGLVLRKIPADEIAAAFGNVSWPLFALGTALFFPAFLLQALRWRALFAGGRNRVPGVGTFFELVCIGQFASLFLPSAAGGDVVRAALLGRDEKAWGAAAGSVVLGRAIGVVALVAFLWAGWFFEPSHLDALPGVKAFSVLFTVLLAAGCLAFALLPDKILEKASSRPRLAGLAANLRGVRALPASRKAGIAALSVLIQFVSNLLTAVLYWAIGLPFPASGIFTLLPLLMLINMVPVSFFNIGVREAAMIALFSHLPGVTPAGCVAAGALGYVSVLFPSALGAWFFARRGGKAGPGAERTDETVSPENGTGEGGAE